MSEKIGYTEEKPGVKSSTRLIFIIGSLAVLVMTGVMVWRGVSPIDCGTFLAMAMAAIGGTKVAGAMAEKKKDNVA
jgi:hypothetical protein